MMRVLVPLKPSRLAPVLEPIQAFFEAEASGGILLILSAAVALVWANSPWGEGYAHFWHTPVAIGFGEHVLSMSLAHWVNDGLMVIFFVLVGLEIKREIVVGELATIRRAALPIAAAIGGMLVPAGIYFLFNRGGAGQHGWGIPMATDIAFAVGVLALVGRSVPFSVKVFLLAIAIVDDLGAVIVIAVFYTSQISTSALLVAGVFLLALITLNVLRVHRPLPYMLLGMGLWAGTLFSGIHATIAGVLLAFTIPVTRQFEELPYIDYQRKMLDLFAREADINPYSITEKQSYALKAMEVASQAVQTPLARVEHALLTPINFIIIPIFALANAGVDLRSGAAAAFESPIMWGVLVGLVVGKPVGVLLASWIAVKSGIASLPGGGTSRQIIGVALLCGIGFTMSLFVGGLAFAEGDHLTGAKLGILLASILAGSGGAFVLLTSGKRAAETAEVG